MHRLRTIDLHNPSEASLLGVLDSVMLKFGVNHCVVELSIQSEEPIKTAPLLILGKISFLNDILTGTSRSPIDVLFS